MAIAYVADASNTTSGTSQATHTATLSVSSGDLVVVCVSTRDNVTIDSCSGSVNGSYTLADPVVLNSNNNNRSAIFYFQNSSAGTETVTVTLSAAGRAGVNISKYTGAATTGALDQDDGASVTTVNTSHTSGSITTTGAGLIVVSACTGGDPGATTFTDFTNLDSLATRYHSYYRIVTGSTAETGDYTTTNSVLSTNKMASFNQAASSLDPIVLRWRQ